MARKRGVIFDVTKPLKEKLELIGKTNKSRPNYGKQLDSILGVALESQRRIDELKQLLVVDIDLLSFHHKRKVSAIEQFLILEREAKNV